MTKPLRIIIVEDSEDDMLLTVRLLQKAGFSLTARRVETAADMEKALGEQPWDIVISDHVMPSFNGLEAFKILRRSSLDIPFIIVSGQIGEETAVEAMKAGVNDYVMKGDLARLVPAIERELKDAAVRRERQLSDEAKQKIDRQYRLLVENANEGIVVTQDGMAKYANPKAAAITGYDREELYAREYLEFLHPEDRQRALDGQAVMLRTNLEIPHFTFRIINRAGEVRWIESNGVAIDWEGRPAVLSFITDITEAKIGEEKLLQATRELEAEREKLEKKNIALHEVLDQFQAEKEAVKLRMLLNMKEAIVPTLQRLKESCNPGQVLLIESVIKELLDIASPFIGTLKDGYAKLTPREIEVCRLIKNGMTSKEIAEALNISRMTVHKYRELIRKKLGLVNNDVSLQSYLQTI